MNEAALVARIYLCGWMMILKIFLADKSSGCG